MASKRDIARESKQLDENTDKKLQITKRTWGKANRGYNIYRVYGNEYFQDDADERTIGFINYPMTLKQVEEWLEHRKEEVIREEQIVAEWRKKSRI